MSLIPHKRDEISPLKAKKKRFASLMQRHLSGSGERFARETVIQG